MEKISYTEEEVIDILYILDLGMNRDYIFRKYGINNTILNNWKEKYKDVKVQKIRKLENENANLKTIITNISMELQGLIDRSR